MQAFRYDKQAGNEDTRYKIVPTPADNCTVQYSYQDRSITIFTKQMRTVQW
jgi:hypothetical protein